MAGKNDVEFDSAGYPHKVPSGSGKSEGKSPTEAPGSKAGQPTVIASLAGWLQAARDVGLHHVSIPCDKADEILALWREREAALEVWPSFPSLLAKYRFLEAALLFFDSELAQTSDAELEGTTSASAPAEFMNFMDAGREFRKIFPTTAAGEPSCADLDAVAEEKKAADDTAGER